MSRESELYKDKIEVSLDGRQIFYLFFGGAVIVGLVFVLGVMVGRRVEARGHVDRAKTAAAVDPLAALDRLEGGNGLSFEGSLRGAETPKPDVEKQIEDRAAHDEPKPAKPEAKLEAKADAPKADAPKAKPDKADKAEAKPEPKPRFTLQLSSFQDKGEAESYLAQLKSNGSGSAYLTEADVDGKTFYRVRLGNYHSLDAANDAKADFEKSSKKTASVMKL
ncbi:MAG TPA: SPOR domain-containing protein [Kofleriaceae bacterium]|jgi:septal ring-binding cell division protein DamX|nr:SPOR domain-containing protein [Kofleriaceae bacterium]